MFDPKNILEQFTGHRGMQAGGGSLQDMLSGMLGGAGPGQQRGGGGLGGMLGGLGGPAANTGSSGGGFLGSILDSRTRGGGVTSADAGGGLLGSILDSRRGGGGAGGLMRVGGLAMLGALAHRAFKAWQAGQGDTAAAVPAAEATAHTAATNDQPFGLAIIRAMVAAAKADGTMDAQERDRIFSEVEKLRLTAEEKGFVFEALEAQPNPGAIAALARTEAQKAEIYLASRLVAPPDTASERAYLDALAHGLKMPAGLREQLDAQAKDVLAAAASSPL